MFFGVPRVYSTYFTPQTEFQDGHHNNAISNEILRSNIISSCFIMSEALNSAHSTAKCVPKDKLLTDCWSHFMNRLCHDICSNLVATKSIQYSYNKTNNLDFHFNILAKLCEKTLLGSILSCTGPLLGSTAPPPSRSKTSTEGTACWHSNSSWTRKIFSDTWKVQQVDVIFDALVSNTSHIQIQNKKRVPKTPSQEVFGRLGSYSNLKQKNQVRCTQQSPPDFGFVE